MVENKLECLVLGCGLDSFNQLWAGWPHRYGLATKNCWLDSQYAQLVMGSGLDSPTGDMD